MNFYWDRFLQKVRDDGGDVKGLHAPSLLKAFYRYLEEEGFRSPEKTRELEATIEEQRKALERGQKQYKTTRATLDRARRGIRDVQHELRFVENPDTTWSSPSSESHTLRPICVSQIIVDRIVEANNILRKVLKDVTHGAA